MPADIMRQREGLGADRGPFADADEAGVEEPGWGERLGQGHGFGRAARPRGGRGTHLDDFINAYLGAPVAAAGLAAGGWAALPAIAEFAGYEGGTGLIAQSVGLKAGIGLSIELGGNYATNSETTIGGVTGTVLASTLIAPSAARIYGLGVKGLTIAGGATGLGSNALTQMIDFEIGARNDFSGSELLLSTGFGALGGRFAAPLQDHFGATSLLFSKYSPVVEELYFAPVTVSGGTADAAKKFIVNNLPGH